MLGTISFVCRQVGSGSLGILSTKYSFVNLWFNMRINVKVNVVIIPWRRKQQQLSKHCATGDTYFLDKISRWSQIKKVFNSYMTKVVNQK